VPSLRDIRKRIRSVKSTQQITKAMKMVAAAKLRRAQDAVVKARPYAQLLQTAIAEVAVRADDGQAQNPLLAARPTRTVELVLVTSDRGLAGAFNAGVLRRAQRFQVEKAEEYELVEISTLGRKARDYCRVRKIPVRKDYAGIHKALSFEKAQEVAQDLAQRFLAGEVDQVLFCYNEFKSAISQKVTFLQLLPVDTSTSGARKSAIDFKYEPGREEVLAELLPRHLAIQVWRVLLESAASEHGARMTAMDAASRNAKDLIDGLTLQYNRARQASITKELMEIVSGAEALK
jgi:F-type H+-transporting ATPase subunit gamma